MKKTAKFYASNPEAKKKKAAYDIKYNSSPERKEYKRELSRVNRATDGWNDGKDASHKKGGGTVKESSSINRARNGMRSGVAKSAKRTGTKK